MPLPVPDSFNQLSGRKKYSEALALSSAEHASDTIAVGKLRPPLILRSSSSFSSFLTSGKLACLLHPTISITSWQGHVVVVRHVFPYFAGPCVRQGEPQDRISLTDLLTPTEHSPTCAASGTTRVFAVCSRTLLWQRQRPYNSPGKLRFSFPQKGKPGRQVLKLLHK